MCARFYFVDGHFVTGFNRFARKRGLRSSGGWSQDTVTGLH